MSEPIIKDINGLEELVKQLAKVSEDVVRAEERVKQRLEVLKDLGYDSEEKAGAALVTMERRIERKKAKLIKDTDDFFTAYKARLDEYKTS